VTELERDRAREFSPKAKFRNPPTMYLDKKDAKRHFRAKDRK
jgi:hypothetical protein